MKNTHFLILSASLIILSITDAAAQTAKKVNSHYASISVLNGAWLTTWHDSSTNASSQEYNVLHDGFFANIGQDSSGRWAETHAGTYEIDGNVYKQKVLVFFASGTDGCYSLDGLQNRWRYPLFEIFQKTNRG